MTDIFRTFEGWSDVYNTFVQINAGFKSRVRYTSVLDPTSMAYYVSEILDAGRDRPLFMVIENYS